MSSKCTELSPPDKRDDDSTFKITVCIAIACLVQMCEWLLLLIATQNILEKGSCSTLAKSNP